MRSRRINALVLVLVLLGLVLSAYVALAPSVQADPPSASLDGRSLDHGQWGVAFQAQGTPSPPRPTITPSPTPPPGGDDTNKVPIPIFIIVAGAAFAAGLALGYALGRRSQPPQLPPQQPPIDRGGTPRRR